MKEQLLASGSFILLFFLIFYFSKLINDIFTPYRLDEELTTKDNPALSLSLAGYLLATVTIYIGALLGPEKDLLSDLMISTAYAAGGIILLNLSRVINDKLILQKFSNIKEIIENRNMGTGAIQLGSYLASGLVIGGAVHGEGGGVHTVLVFFLLGQVTLILFTKIYNWITPFCIHEQIKAGNTALGVAISGNLIAIGLILLKGVKGDFISWEANLLRFAIAAIAGFLALPLVRLIFDKVIIPRANLNKEICEDRNLGAGFLEAATSISFSLLIFYII